MPQNRFRTIVIGMLGALSMGISCMALAVQPDEILSDPALESRARSISAGLRCLVCQNQSIDDSDAPLARDLRLLVRERLKAGDSDADVERYLVERYGEFVLLKPVLGWHTLILWLVPVVALIAATWAAIRGLGWNPTQRATVSQSPLTKEEETRIKNLMKAGD
jgi:cytochrome c-type biogenesis protein CcmH